MPPFKISSLDIFGSKITFNYKNDSVYRTSFGGIMTLAMVSFLAILFFRSFLTLISKSTVTYTPSVSIDTEPSQLIFGGNHSMIAVKYDQINFLTSPLVNITFEHTLYNTTSDGKTNKYKNEVPLEPCTIQHFQPFFSDQFNWTEAFIQNEINDFLCLKLGDTYKVGGQFINDNFYFLKFTMSQCFNSTQSTRPWNPVCQDSQNAANQGSEDSRIVFFFTNNLINPEKPTNPVKNFLQSTFFTVQPQRMYTTANILFNLQTIKTDDSIMPYSEINSQDYIVYDQNDYKQSYAVGNYTNYSEIFIQRSLYTTKIDRRFTKIDEVISYMGGFCQIFILFSSIIVGYYNDFIYTIELANRLYNFEFNSQNTFGKNSKKKKLEQTNSPQKGNQQQLQVLISDPNMSNLKENNNFTFPLVNNLQNNLNSTLSESKQKGQSSPKTKDLFNNKQDETNKKDNTLTNQDKIHQQDKKIKQLFEDHSLGLMLEVNKSNTNNPSSRINNCNDALPMQRYFPNLHRHANSNAQLQNYKSWKEDHHLSQDLKVKVKCNGQVSKGNELQLFEKQKIKEKNIEQIKSQRQITQCQIHKYREKSSSMNIIKNPSQCQQKYEPFQAELHPMLAKLSLNHGQFINQNQINHDIQIQPLQNLNQKINVIQTEQQPNHSCLIEKLPEKNHSSSPTQKLSIQGHLLTKNFLDKELKSVLDQRNRSIKLGFHYLVNKLTFGKYFLTEQVKLIDEADRLVRMDLDIFTILDKLKEMEKIKQLLLSQEQQTLFNFFPKPIISVKKQKNLLSPNNLEFHESKCKEDKIQVNKTSSNLQVLVKSQTTVRKAVAAFKLSCNREKQLSDYEQLYQCYEKLLEEEDAEPLNSSLNKKLIDMLGLEILKIFQATRKMKQKFSGESNKKTILLLKQHLPKQDKPLPVGEDNQKEQISSVCQSNKNTLRQKFQGDLPQVLNYQKIPQYRSGQYESGLIQATEEQTKPLDSDLNEEILIQFDDNDDYQDDLGKDQIIPDK